MLETQTADRQIHGINTPTARPTDIPTDRLTERQRGVTPDTATEIYSIYLYTKVGGEKGKYYLFGFSHFVAKTYSIRENRDEEKQKWSTYI